MNKTYLLTTGRLSLPFFLKKHLLESTLTFGDGGLAKGETP